MKKNFTLVELLIAITIIVILAGMLFPAVSGAIKKAETAKAKAAMAVLVNAIKQYESTYGVLPYKDTTIGKVDDGDYEKFIKMLQGNPPSSGDYKDCNKRKIKFLDVVGNEEGLYEDPWGNNYIIFLDADGNGAIGDAETDKIPAGLSTSKVYGSVVIYSKGPDGKDYDSSSDEKKLQGRDNVYSVPTVWDKKELVHIITQ